jgi:hypothetical protein
MAERTGVELIAALRKSFDKIGTPSGTNGTRVPKVNDANLEFAIAKVLQSFADEREKIARVNVVTELAAEIGKASNVRTNIFSSSHSSLDAQVVKGQTRINRDALRLAISKRYGIKIADEIIAEAVVVGDPSLRLYPSIVQVSDD